MQIFNQWPVKLHLMTVSAPANDALRFQYALTFLLLHLAINSEIEHKTWPTSSILQFSFSASSDNQKTTLQGPHQHLNQRGKMNTIPNSQQSKLKFSPWEKNILAHIVQDNHLSECVDRECSCLNSYQNPETEHKIYSKLNTGSILKLPTYCIMKKKKKKTKQITNQHYLWI